MSSRCHVRCEVEGPEEGPPLPEGMDFWDLEGLCYEIEDVPGSVDKGELRQLGEGELDFAGEDIYRSLERLREIRVVRGSCDVRKWGSIACTEALAVCSQTPCLEGSSASADAPAVYYNIDRIRSWVRKHALNNLAFIFKQCLEIDKSYNYERWPRDLAYSAALDVLEGTSRLLRESGTHPFKLRDDVTTPAGTTIRGLIAMESEGG